MSTSRAKSVCAALANPDPRWNGQWDAAITYEYRTKSRRKKIAYPFLQDVHPDVAAAGWHKFLRCKLADIINPELERADTDVRFDPRTLEEQGIDKVPDVHLGQKLTRLERSGVPTKLGAQNEQNQWDFQMRELQRQFTGGDKADGDPQMVSGYVTGAMQLIRARLFSRATYVAYHGERESAIWTPDLPSPTTKRRELKNDWRSDLLKKQADEVIGD